MATLKGPDLPTGGELIYDEKALGEIYRTGRGSFKVRSKWRYLKSENLIEIYEIPYSTTSEAIMDKVAELIKAGKIKEIADMRDETDLSGLKLTIDLKRGTDPDKLMAKLFRATPLMDSQSCNFNILIAGMPRVMGVREILEEWTAWRMDCVRRRVYHEMKKKEDKLHLLKGLRRILLDIDRAIAIIRETEEDAEVVPNLMIGFGIDQIQAEYVADIRLRNINKEYILKRTQEVEALEGEIADLQATVNDPKRIRKIITKERDELLVFTDKQQCYKTRLSEFDDSKASVLGDYLPTKLAMEAEERVLWACIPGDYSGQLLFFFENGKAARVELSAYQTQTRRKKLTGAYSDKSPLVSALLLREDLEMAVYSSDGRCMIFHTAALAPKTTRTTQGVNVMALKPKRVVTDAKPLADTPIVNLSRYRARSLPIAGALLREEDRGETQMSLLEPENK